MEPETVYGLRCARKDEKALIERVDAYLAPLSRRTGKVKNPSLLAGYLPFVFKHIHFNLNKDTGTSCTFYPNEDENGRLSFPDRPECSWLLRVRIDLQTFPAASQEKAEEFVAGLLGAVGFEAVVLEAGELR